MYAYIFIWLFKFWVIYYAPENVPMNIKDTQIQASKTNNKKSAYNEDST